MRMVKLYYHTRMHHQYSIIIHNGIQPMCYGQHCTMFKTSSYCVLYQSVSLGVHIGCGLVQYENATVPNYSASQTQQLFLACTKVSSAFDQ